jgi:signal transduction histidine kinase
MSLRKFLIILSLLILSGFYNGLQARLKNILVLHSYNSGLSWTDRINAGIFESFKNEYYRTIDLRCEFMDSKHFESADYFQNYYNYLAYKYSRIPIDVIICSDNTAFDFLSLYHNHLFKNVPVVFCGVNYCDSIPKGFTGVMEDIDLVANLKLITTIHPGYNKLYIINDRSITGKSITKKLNHVISTSFSDLRYEYLTDYTLKELEGKLATLKSNDVVFMLLFNFDRTGTAYSYDVILDEILPYCKVPVYGTWDFYLGKGIVGGKITNAYNQGQMASVMAKQIVNGKEVAEIPVISGLSEYMFDHKIVKKNHISNALIPDNTIVINRPYDFILKNKLFFILTSVIILLLVAMIVLLYYFLRKTKMSLHKEQDLVTRLELKSVETEIALEKAEQSNKLKAAFLANISHEIRTPMNGILGFSDLLNDYDEPEIQREYIKNIHLCGKQLLNIINDILDISLIESQQIKIHKELFSLNQTINNLFDTFTKHPGIANKKIFKSIYLADGDDFISSDQTKLNQILTNLIANAIKFTRKGSIFISYCIKEPFIEFEVKDEGIGIAPENLELIFDRFRQVEQDGSEIFGGNGLGLSISKAYVEMLNGKIWVESTLGVGSSFYFTIPYKKAVSSIINTLP